MSNSYETDKDRKEDDIDFDQYLAESDDPAGKSRLEKPVTRRSHRRLINALDQDTTPNSDKTRQLDGNLAEDGLVASDRVGRDLGGGNLAGSDLVDSGHAKSDPVDGDLIDSDQAGGAKSQTSSRGRIVERMAWSTKQRLIVAFQGESGAYSEQALRNYFGSEAISLPCTDFRGIFDTIHSGKAQRGILPVENSLAGTVSAAYDQLADHDLRIQGEVILRVEHCLMAPAGLKLQDIKRVKSHPQALAQCQQTLRRLGLEAVVHYDTAGAARDLADQPEPATAAIASALAARTYGLEILSHHFEDEPLNYTRFFILGLTDPPRKDPSKTSVIFTTRHQPGALHRVLSELAERNINLTKIESRPRRNRPWHYLFYVDFEGHEDQPLIREALLGILKQASFLKVLGSYPAAPLLLGDQGLNTRD